MPLKACGIHIRHFIPHISQASQFPLPECVHLKVMHLLYFPCRINRTGKYRHNAMSARFLSGSQADRLEQIHRSVRTGRRGRTHCPCYHNRFNGIYRQIEKIRRFVKRIRSVRYNNAVNIVPRHNFV